MARGGERKDIRGIRPHEPLATQNGSCIISLRDCRAILLLVDSVEAWYQSPIHHRAASDFSRYIVLPAEHLHEQRRIQR